MTFLPVSYTHLYNDFDTNIDFFFKNYKWIRYIYDFGDDWRHKINIEKYELDYKERYPKLVKYKGDNFMEDSGGVWNWEMNEEVYPFDREFVESQFRQMVFPKHKQKDKVKVCLLYTSYHQFQPIGTFQEHWRSLVY